MRGLYNNAPLKTFLKSELADIGYMQRFVDVGITNVLKGTYVDELKADLNRDLEDIMFAEFAYAGFFPPAEFGGTSYFDGSSVYDIDIFSLITTCKSMGYSQQDIVIDVILSSAKTLKQVDASKYTSVQMAWRFLEISRYYSALDGLLRGQYAYPNVNYRALVSPTGTMPSNYFPLNFT